MTSQKYRLNEEYGRHINSQICVLVEKFMIGDEGVIATARALAGYEHEVSEFNPNLAKYHNICGYKF